MVGYISAVWWFLVTIWLISKISKLRKRNKKLKLRCGELINLYQKELVKNKNLENSSSVDKIVDSVYKEE